MKKVIWIVLALLVLFGAAFIYHCITVQKVRNDVLAEQEQNALLQKRVEEVQKKLAGSEEDRKGLKKQLSELMDSITEDVYVFDSAEIMNEIQDIGELATVAYRYTNVATVDGQKEFALLNIKIPFSSKTAVISMNGVIKVGVDVTKIRIDSDEATKTITVTLPPAQLLSNELDEKSMEIYDESSGLFNKVDLQDSSNLRSQLKEKAEKNAAENGVYEQATKNAEGIIRCMLESIPGLKESYKISFR